jgi:hypothetical protein
MSRTLQFKRYANTAVANTTGADGELIIDITNKTITVHNGNTVGGSRIATESFVGNSINSFSIAVNTDIYLTRYAANTANAALSQAITANAVALGAFALANTNAILVQSAYAQANAEPIGSSAYTQSAIATTVGQAAFNQANASNILAQSAYNQGNTANLIANTAAANITILYGINTTQNTSIASNAVFSQSAYNQANNASNGFIQNAQAASYTIQSTDAGKYLYYTPAANVILYLPWTSNISFTNGTTIMVVSQNTGAAANIVVTPNVNVSLFTAGNTISGSHNVNPYGVATLMMVKANTWFLTGSGIT